MYFKKAAVLVMAISAILVNQLSAQSAKDYQWKMMAGISGSYNWDTSDGSHINSDFWATYSTRKQEIQNNLLRGKKLGFNSVRIFLNYIDQATYPYYDHAWPQQIGSGVPSQTSTYRADVKDLVDWCSANQIKVCLTLFYYGGANDMIWYSRTGNLSRYAKPDSTVDNLRIDQWLTDAKGWVNYMFGPGGIDVSKVEVVELQHEACPSIEFSNSSQYPTQPNNIFLLELGNYIHHTWSTLKIMLSVSMTSADYWQHLYSMLNTTYTRPQWLTAFSAYDSTDYSGKYFDILSIHQYGTYNSRIYFNDILRREPYQSQPYEWFIGECGFSIGDSLAYEIDQAKYFQYLFQVAADLSARLQSTSHHLKGIGIWSFIDYKIDCNEAGHSGIMSSETPLNVRKRKAASVIEDNFEGYVDNPDFEIGPGNDANFNDSPYCNGWTSWYASTQTFNSNDYSYTTADAGHGHVLQLNPASSRWIGWSSAPGGMVRVKPGTNVTVSADVRAFSTILSKAAPMVSTLSTNVFISVAWVDAFNQWVGSTPVPSTLQSFYPSVWKLISATYTVPTNAYYAVAYLMAYNNPYTVQFDNVSYTPEWRPLISFTFDDDISYFGANALLDHDCAIGWKVKLGSTSRTDGKLTLNPSTTVHTTDALPGGRVTAIRTRSNYEYSVVCCASTTSWSGLRIISLGNTSSDNYPSVERQNKFAYFNSSLPWGIYSPDPLQADSINCWIQAQIENVDGVSQLKEVTAFEHTLNGALPKIGANAKNTLPFEFSLAQNYPNPFNPSTAIKFDVPEPTLVHLVVYDYLGREVATLVNGYRPAGSFEVKFDASRLASGIYLYRIQAGKHSAVRKMQLVK